MQTDGQKGSIGMFAFTCFGLEALDNTIASRATVVKKRPFLFIAFSFKCNKLVKQYDSRYRCGREKNYL